MPLCRKGRMRLTNIGSVQEREQEENKQWRQNTNIAFSKEFLFRYRIYVCPICIVDHFLLLIWHAGFDRLVRHDRKM